uniref:tyrosine/phenylalanine carboxypeptidase domain-containing protein n=1 Tax=Amphritea sp. TaxID=1872502 RepID=UPI00356221FF
ESYVDKIDQYKSIGTPDFLYESFRYYGEPSEKDIRNANFILHLPDSEPNSDVILCADEIVARLETFARAEGYQYQIKLDDSMIANALVSGTTVKVNSTAQASETEVDALAHHELGVHLVTTLNARNQPLKILSMGCPVNTMTQEGLAILSEYLAGCMTLPRLKVLALRVLAVDSMVEENDFKKTFLFLKEQHNVADDQAFTITARVYRGGGFTKDYLYLQGLHQMLNAYENRPDFNNLLSGKVSIEHLSVISGLIDKGYLLKPELISPAIAHPQDNDAIQKFITHAIK